MTAQYYLYTTSTTERDNAADKAGYRTEGIACYVYDAQISGAVPLYRLLNAPPSGSIPLYRLFNVQSGDYFYTTSADERDNAVTQDGYQTEGVACYAYDSQVSGTSALYRLSKNGQHFYTTSTTERDHAVAEYGYQHADIACYIHGAQIPGSTPLYQMYKSGQHFYTTSASECDNAIAQDGYQRTGVACYVFGPNSTGDHLYTTSASECDTAIANAGYSNKGIACYVYDAQVSGTTALYKLLKNGQHFYTTSTSERDEAVNNDGYQSEGVACYVYDSQTSGTIPLYRLRRLLVAIVLSGGGSLGDFELGAVRFLYDYGVRPDIICGNSVGSIIGAKLAEGEGGPDQGLRGLEANWLKLQTNADMYMWQDWLHGIDPSILKLVTGKAANADPAPNPLTAPILWFHYKIDPVILCIHLCEALQLVNTHSSLYSLQPVKDKLVTKLDIGKIGAWSQAGYRTLRLAVVSLESGALRFVTETGDVVERDHKTPVRVPTLPHAPEYLAIVNKIEGLKAEKAKLHSNGSDPSDRTKEPAFASTVSRRLNTQIEQEVRNLHEHVANSPHTVLNVSIANGVLASASIPAFFEPVPLGEEMYVDGGVRCIVPTRTAIDLGADVIYTIVPLEAKMNREEPNEKRSALDVAYRSLANITLNEILLTGSNPPGGWETGLVVKVIQSLNSVHDDLIIDPGYISICMAYGYMRAADVVVGSQQNQQRVEELAEEITSLRTEIFLLECFANGKAIPHGPITFDEAKLVPQLDKLPVIRQKKRGLKALVNERCGLGGPMPADAQTWWKDWERHAWQALAPTPWDTFKYGGKTIEAETGPS